MKTCATCYYNYHSLNYTEEQLCNVCKTNKKYESWKSLDSNYNETTTTKKPPLGLMPFDIWKKSLFEKRIYDIFDAMRRYSNENVAIPVEWIDELERAMNVLCLGEVEDE